MQNANAQNAQNVNVNVNTTTAHNNATHTVTFSVATQYDTDDVMLAILQLLASNCTQGYDELLDVFNSAYSEDMRLCDNEHATARVTIESALEALDDDDVEFATLLLLQALLQRNYCMQNAFA